MPPSVLSLRLFKFMELATLLIFSDLGHLRAGGAGGQAVVG